LPDADARPVRARATRSAPRLRRRREGFRTPARGWARAALLAGVAVGLLAPAAAVRAQPSTAEIQQRITRESTALAKVVEDYNKVNEELKATKAAVAKHSASLPELERTLTDARSAVSAIASTAYKNGQLREVDAVLGAGGQQALLDRIGTLDHLARGRQAQIAGYTTARQRYDVEKGRLDATLAKQNIQMRDLKARKAKIEADLKNLLQLRRQAYGSEQESGSAYTGTIPAISGKAGVAVRFAYNAIGKPYVWAGEGPGGYDCSGLTLAAWRAAGKSLPHNAAMQWDVVAHISRSQLMPGDLVFYAGLGHVGLYVGSGRIIHAPNAGETVKLSSVNIMPPYGYGRVR
jgi:cell wall-associated NlpC family hydrolase